MKHLVLIAMIALSLTANSQGILADLQPSATGYSFRTIPSYQKPGASDTIIVTVQKEVIDRFKLKDIDLYKMSLAASRKASGSLKEPSSYKLGEKFNVYIVKGEIKYSWEYYGENAYGAKKKNTMVLTFDEKGVLKSSTVL